MCRLKSPMIISSAEEEIKFSSKAMNFEVKVGLEKDEDR